MQTLLLLAAFLTPCQAARPTEISTASFVMVAGDSDTIEMPFDGQNEDIGGVHLEVSAPADFEILPGSQLFFDVKAHTHQVFQVRYRVRPDAKAGIRVVDLRLWGTSMMCLNKGGYGDCPPTRLFIHVKRHNKATK